MIISISEQQQQHEDKPDENIISINVMLILWLGKDLFIKMQIDFHGKCYQNNPPFFFLPNWRHLDSFFLLKRNKEEGQQKSPC